MRFSFHPRRPRVCPADPGRTRTGGPETGETLLEILVAVALMGMAFTAILSGMITSARIAKDNQEASRANQVLSATADRLLEPIGAYRYRPCAAANDGVPDNNNGNTDWNHPWASYAGYVPEAPTGLLPSTWRVRITDIRYLLGPDVSASFLSNEAGDASDPDGNVDVPQWSSWGPAGFYRCADIKSMNLTSEQAAAGVLQRDGGLQQIKIVVEKPDGGGAHGFLKVDEIVVTKRDQRCPTTNYSNADRGPC